jgi:iron(III) transport system substrate-binding protein
MKKLVLLCVMISFAGLLFATGSQEVTAPKKVIAYTAHEDDIINAMVPMFKAETGMEIEFVKMGSGDVIKRVAAEASNPQCDVIWSIGGNSLRQTPIFWRNIFPKIGTKSVRFSRLEPTGFPTQVS